MRILYRWTTLVKYHINTCIPRKSDHLNFSYWVETMRILYRWTTLVKYHINTCIPRKSDHLNFSYWVETMRILYRWTTLVKYHINTCIPRKSDHLNLNYRAETMRILYRSTENSIHPTPNPPPPPHTHRHTNTVCRRYKNVSIYSVSIISKYLSTLISYSGTYLVYKATRKRVCFKLFLVRIKYVDIVLFNSFQNNCLTILLDKLVKIIFGLEGQVTLTKIIPPGRGGESCDLFLLFWTYIQTKWVRNCSLLLNKFSCRKVQIPCLRKQPTNIEVFYVMCCILPHNLEQRLQHP